MRLASTQVVADAVTQAKVDLDRAVTLWEHVAEQKLLEGLPSHSPEPVPDTEAFARRNVASRDRRAQLTLLDAMHRLRGHMAGAEDAIKRIRTARLALGAQVPAVEAALNAHEHDKQAGLGPNLDKPTVCRTCEDLTDHARLRCPSCGVYPSPHGPAKFKMTGRVGTSGLSLDEVNRQRKGAVEAESACAVCDLGVSVVGRLIKGMCRTHYQAWWRDDEPDGERHVWIARRRQEIADTAAEQGAKVVPLHSGVYRDNLKDVA